MKTDLIRQVRENSGWFMALGVVMLILGIAAIVEPFMATVAIARVFSWIFLFAGIIRIVYAVQSRSDRCDQTRNLTYGIRFTVEFNQRVKRFLLLPF